MLSEEVTYPKRKKKSNLKKDDNIPTIKCSYFQKSWAGIADIG